MAEASCAIYLGAAPGVGKTFAMLGEAHRRLERGTDVVVGFVETHGRPRTDGAARDGLEVVPRRASTTAARRSTEMDVDAVLARTPAGRARRRARAHQRARLAATPKRWQDVEELLDAGHRRDHHGQHPAPGVAQRRRRAHHRRRQRETVPDEVVRRADQIELVDMSPEALRRRMAHGNIYAAEQGRRRPGQLLPARQPHRAARAGPAVGGRPGRRGPPAVPHRARHQRDLGGPRADRGRADRRTGGRDPLRRAARIAERSGARPARRARRCAATGSPAPPVGAIARPAAPGRGRSAAASTPSSATTSPTALLDFARGRQRHPDRARRVTGAAAGPDVSAEASAHRVVRRVRRHRRPHRHPRRGRPRAAACPSPAAARLGRAPDRCGWPLAVVAARRCSPCCCVLLQDGARPVHRRAAVLPALTVLAALVGGLLPGVRRGAAGGSCCSTTSSPRRCTRFTIAEPENVVALVGLRGGRGRRWRSVVDRAARRHPAGRAGCGPRRDPGLARAARVLRRATTAGRGAGAGPRDVRHASRSRCWSATSGATVDLRRQSSGPTRRAVPRTPTSTCRSSDGPARSACSGRVLRRGRPPGARRVRRARPPLALDRQRLAARPTRPAARPRATGCAPPCWPPSATTCAPRWPRSRPRSSACVRPTSPGPTTTRPELLADDRRGRRPARPPGRQPARHVPAADRRASPRCSGRSASTRSCRPRAGRRRRTGRVTLRRPRDAAVGRRRPGPAGAGRRQHRRQRRQYSPGRARVAVARQRPRRPRRAAGRRPRPGRARRRPRTGCSRPFQRLGDAPRGAGVGLGLAVARGFAEAMGGT